MKLLELTIQHLKDDLLAKVGVIATQAKQIEELKGEVRELQTENRELRCLKYKRLFFGGSNGADKGSVTSDYVEDEMPIKVEGESTTERKKSFHNRRFSSFS